MRISVTQDHIDRGVKGDSCYCPVAIAMREADYRSPKVGRVSVRFDWDGGRAVLPVPYSVKTFVYRFDAGLDVWPFEFELTH